MIKAVIFDLNGIFVQAPKLSERFFKDFGVKEDIFVPVLREVMDKLRQPGAGPAFKYWGEAIKKWNLKMTEQEFWDYWFKVEHFSERMVAFARNLKKKGIRVFILSNNFKERSLYYDHYPWVHDAVDKIYFSWQTGFVKPDVRAWTHLLEENNLRPKECIYFDDQDRNLKASESVGIKAFHFTNEVELEKIVNENLG